MNNSVSFRNRLLPAIHPGCVERKEFRWEGKLFLKDRVRCLFHIPLDFGKVMTRNMARISQAGALTPEAPLVLSDHTSRWNMAVYIEVAREVSGAGHERLSGTFLSKVFEGPSRTRDSGAGRWANGCDRRAGQSSAS